MKSPVWPGSLDNLSDPITVSPIGTDERRQRDQAGRRHQRGDRTDAANVLLAIDFAKAQSESLRKLLAVLCGQHRRRCTQSVPNVVAIEQHRGAAQLVQLPVQFVGDRALAATAQSGEPNDDTALTESLLRAARRSTVCSCQTISDFAIVLSS